MTDFFNSYKEHLQTLPRDLAWDNWKSWKDAKIGDKVQGYVADAFFRPEEKDANGTVIFRAQAGITIKELESGEFINVGVKYLPFVLKQVEGARVGDPITVEFTEQKDPTQRGHNGVKIFSYYWMNTKESEGNKTIRQLVDEDRIAGGSTEPTIDEKEEAGIETEVSSTEDDAFKTI